MRYFIKTRSQRGMSCQGKMPSYWPGRTRHASDRLVALTEVSHLPGTLHSFLHYVNERPSPPGVEYMRHSYLISLGVLVTRIVGYSRMAMWLYKGGPEIEELLLPTASDEDAFT